MARHPYPNNDKPRTTEEGGSVRITIPAGPRDALEVGPGEEPEEIEWDDDEREITYKFADD